MKNLVVFTDDGMMEPETFHSTKDGAVFFNHCGASIFIYRGKLLASGKMEDEPETLGWFRTKCVVKMLFVEGEEDGKGAEPA